MKRRLREEISTSLIKLIHTNLLDEETSRKMKEELLVPANTGGRFANVRIQLTMVALPKTFLYYVFLP